RRLTRSPAERAPGRSVGLARGRLPARTARLLGPPGRGALAAAGPRARPAPRQALLPLDRLAGDPACGLSREPPAAAQRLRGLRGRRRRQLGRAGARWRPG